MRPQRHASHPAWDEWIEIPSLRSSLTLTPKSHPAWDEWIEILHPFLRLRASDRLIPLGMSGLKLIIHLISFFYLRLIPLGMSGLKWPKRFCKSSGVRRLIPLGMSGLKSLYLSRYSSKKCLIPLGMSGLK